MAANLGRWGARRSRPWLLTRGAFLLLALMGCGSESGSDLESGAEDGGRSMLADDAGRLAPICDVDSLGACGAAIDAPADEWTWIDFPESRCMNDTPTGIAVNLHEGAKGALIFLMGGLACFSDSSCALATNKDGYDRAKFEQEKTTLLAAAGVMRRDDSDNPFHDWHIVYVPQCTGDYYSGNKPDGTGRGGYTQIGYQNIGEYLERLVPTFKDVEQVVLSGSSAGGAGASLNWERTQRAFGDIPVHALIDSAPQLGPDYLPPCLLQRFDQSWNTNKSMLEGCDYECGPFDDYATSIDEYFDYFLPKQQALGRRYGLLSSEDDAVMRLMFGFGANDCANVDGPPTAYPPGWYRPALDDLVQRRSARPNWAAWVAPGQQHGMLLDNPLGTKQVDGVTLTDFIRSLITGDGFRTVMPTSSDAGM